MEHFTQLETIPHRNLIAAVLQSHVTDAKKIGFMVKRYRKKFKKDWDMMRHFNADNAMVLRAKAIHREIKYVKAHVRHSWTGRLCSLIGVDHANFIILFEKEIEEQSR